jgi:hypothetical protein
MLNDDNCPSDLIVKFNTPTDTSTLHTLGSTALVNGYTGIDFNLQIVEKSNQNLGSGTVGSTVVGSNKINNTTSQELANVIARYFANENILTEATNGVGGAGRNIRSMKLIVNVDPTA